MRQKKLVEFKGTKDGLVLQMDRDHDFEEVYNGLKDKLTQATSFFKGASIVGIDGRTVSVKEKLVIQELFSSVNDISIVSLDPFALTPPLKVKNALNNQPVSDKTDTSEAVIIESPVASTEIFSGLVEGITKFHRGTLRSGMAVVFKGNVVVLGDVNPGAEIIADGNIIVMGHFRGVAHAGANGNDKAYVCANKLHPTQLRIGKMITRPPEDAGHPIVPEIAFIKDQQIVIEPYL